MTVVHILSHAVIRLVQEEPHQIPYPNAFPIIARDFNKSNLKVTFKLLPTHFQQCQRNKYPHLLLHHHQRCLSYHASSSLWKSDHLAVLHFPLYKQWLKNAAAVGRTGRGTTVNAWHWLTGWWLAKWVCHGYYQLQKKTCGGVCTHQDHLCEWYRILWKCRLCLCLKIAAWSAESHQQFSSLHKISLYGLVSISISTC